MNEVIDFLATSPSAEQIIAFKLSPEIDEIWNYLAERNRSGSITPEERLDLDEFLRMDHFVSMLKIRAREKLADK